jgi:hypothetical protein
MIGLSPTVGDFARPIYDNARESNSKSCSIFRSLGYFFDGTVFRVLEVHWMSPGAAARFKADCNGREERY